MGKFAPDAIYDAQLDILEGDQVHACAGQPTTALEATTTFQLATEDITGGNYAKADGDVSGRKNTLTPGVDTVIDNTGLADHIAVTDASGTVLKEVTTCTGTTLTAGGGNTADIGAFAHEIRDVQ